MKNLRVVAVIIFGLLAALPSYAAEQEFENLRYRLEVQEQQLEQQRAEIEVLKATVQRLVEGTVQSANSAVDCPPNCRPAQSVSEAGSPQQVATVAAGAEQTETRRFRLGGDVRLRFEPIIQDLTPTRYRTRLRVRFGVDATLNQDFKGGFYLVSGALDDPVSTNVTLTQFFTRKSIGIDRGWITYRPAEHDWLEVTGGKFTPGWQRTSLSLDPDLNPEGLQEKLSFPVNNPFLKKVTLSGMQLIFNELPGTIVPFSSGSDSYAFGGQLGAQLHFGERVTTNLYGSAINWQNTDAVIQAITAGALAGNRNTNATTTTGTDVRYASKFLYADIIADT
ncbi:MAG: putative porin, partial [Acidobacteriales bacterium]|nr:putative porin [Terriglobales bacterium]